jgi:hypothetical protein
VDQTWPDSPQITSETVIFGYCGPRVRRETSASGLTPF